VRRKKQFSGGRKKKLLSTDHMADKNNVRAMKIMSSLLLYYHQHQSFLGAFVSCQMIERTMNFGHCEDSVFGLAAFAAALVNILDDIDEGTAWARSTLSLMEMYDKDTLIQSINAPLYGMVLLWKGKQSR